MDVSGGNSSGGKRQHSSLVVDVPPHGQLWAVTGEDAPVTPSKSPRVELGTSGASGSDADVVARQSVSPIPPGSVVDVSQQATSPRDDDSRESGGNPGGDPGSSSTMAVPTPRQVMSPRVVGTAGVVFQHLANLGERVLRHLDLRHLLEDHTLYTHYSWAHNLSGEVFSTIISWTHNLSGDFTTLTSPFSIIPMAFTTTIGSSTMWDDILTIVLHGSTP